MPDIPDNLDSQSSFSKLKTKFLGLTLRLQIFAVIGAVALVSFLVVGATQIINVVNPDEVPGVRLRFQPIDATRAPGEFLPVDLLLDTASEQVVAVQAVFDIDESRLDLVCNSLADCPDITIDPAWGTIAELNRQGSQVTISVGTNTPVSGAGIGVANIRFAVLPTAPLGDATASFDANNSAVIVDDGFGTNIVDELHSEEWTVALGGPVDVVITNGPGDSVDCNVPSATITWTTNVLSNSQVAYVELSTCPGCTWDEFIAIGVDGVVTADPTGTLNHQVVLTGLSANSTYYYRARSDAVNGTGTAVSPEGSFFTGCVQPPPPVCQVGGLSANPAARSAVITWSTDQAADSQMAVSYVSGPGPAYNQSFSSGILTLSHSLQASGLSPNTTYRVVASSSGCGSQNIQFTTEDEDLSLDANVVLAVNRDRVCQEWLSCGSSVEVETVGGVNQPLCFDRILCKKLDPQTGACLDLADTLPGSGSAQEFTIVSGNAIESSISQAKLFSGYANVGAQWQGFAQSGSVPGLIPVSAQEQVGSAQNVPNGDFEAGFAFPWVARFDDPLVEGEIKATVTVTEDTTTLRRDLNQVLQISPRVLPDVSGVKVPLGRSLRAGPAGEPLQYYVTFDARSGDGRVSELIVQFGYKDYNSFKPVGTDIVPVSTGWQRLIAGPLDFGPSDLPTPGTGEQTYLGFLARTSGLAEPVGAFFLDNVRIQPVLHSRPGEVSPQTHIARSCRQYPSESAPVCRFFDTTTGRELQGWEGYCLLSDPRNTRRCIQWAPLEMVAGSSSALTAYGAAGYGTAKTDRLPLYYCTQVKGNAPYERQSGEILGTKFGDETFGFIYNIGLSKGWNKHSGMIAYNIINDKSGRSLTTIGPDPLYDYEVEQILVRINRAESGDWPTGTQLSLNRANGFEDVWCSDCATEGLLAPPSSGGFSSEWMRIVNDQTPCDDFGEGNDTNMFGVKARFASNGAFEMLEAGLCDGSVGDGWIEASVIFYVREYCTEIAQVVDSFGTNTAWAGRIHNKDFVVPGLGYRLNQDLVPFGGIVAPEPDYDPSKWEASEAEPGSQPLYVEPANKTQFPQEPHQARASSPYGATRAQGSCVNLATSVNHCWVVQCSAPLPGTTDPICSPPTDTGKTCSQNGDCTAISASAWCAPASGGGGGGGGGVCDSDFDCSQGDICSFQCNPAEIRLGLAVCVSGKKVGSPCAKHQDCGFGDDGLPGRCTGAVPPPGTTEKDFITAIQCSPTFSYAAELFARSQAVWKWSTLERRYRLNPDLGWDITSNTSVSKPPRVENVKLKGGYGSVRDGSGNIVFSRDFGTVTLEFNSVVVNPEQLPLVRYTVDWGDGKISEESGLKIADQSTKPHVLTHTYIGSNTYQPRIQVEDNWGWCSGTGGNNYSGDGSMCDSWTNAPQVIVGG